MSEFGKLVVGGSVCKGGGKREELEEDQRRFTTLPSSSFNFFSCPKQKSHAVRCLALNLAQQDDDGDEQVEEFQVVTALTSYYNDIVILDTPHSRMLLLDSSHNVHSIYNKAKKWTGSYWDECASLPAIVPQGPIAIFGLGGGTAAHLMLDLWPSLVLEGWEIDEIFRHLEETWSSYESNHAATVWEWPSNGTSTWLTVTVGPSMYPMDVRAPYTNSLDPLACNQVTKLLIDRAREYLGLSDLEKHTSAGGILHVHAGDALSPSVNIPGGHLFQNGSTDPASPVQPVNDHIINHSIYYKPLLALLIPYASASFALHLTSVYGYAHLGKYCPGIVIDLFSDGKVLPELQEVATWLELYEKLMPNGRLMVNCGAANDGASNTISPEVSSIDGTWVQNSTIKALCQAFPGHVGYLTFKFFLVGRLHAILIIYLTIPDNVLLMVEIFHSLSFGRHRKGGREPFTSGVPFFCGARILKALAEGTCLQIMSSRMETEVVMIWGAIAEKHFCETFSLLSTSFLSSSSSLPVPAWLLIVTLPPHWLLFHLWPSPHAERVGIEALLLLNPHL
ncbi:hypothetical protein TEA_024625 [Camellia sinensis var. sinensis]|uniref:Uncharacterized protein n=1 Tax=Camellia sinensis var. sinensis TaxID=542762 RepID=A0A4S4DXH7_CAMSN|nr:hypothetical protein TEA_024625 [Camellia sinensis var. sinensis]